eukprot:gene14961-biopygen15023
MFLEQGFKAFDLVSRIAQGRAFSQFQVDHQFQSPGSREELLGHKAEQRHRADKQQQGQDDHRLAPTHAPFHQASYALIEGCAVGIRPVGAMLGRMNLRQVRQEFFPQVRHEHHGGDPRGQQRNGHHLEDRAGVFTGARLRRGNRQETRGRDQGAGEHREGCAGPGETGGLEPVVPLLHFDRHHFHGDDRIVHQQAQRQHQRAEGDFVQADAEVIHGGKRHGQHQRNRQGDHHAGAHAQGEKAHQQHNRQGFGEHLDEFADTGFYRCRLVRHLAQFHTGRKVLLQACEFAFQGLAQHQDVATITHGHGQPDGVGAHVAHARCRWIVEATMNLGHVTDTERTITDADREVANLLNGLEVAGHP